jgi:hypothetical protein
MIMLEPPPRRLGIEREYAVAESRPEEAGASIEGRRKAYEAEARF